MKQFFRSISLRLLLFNLLLVFLPIAGFLYLDTYEKQLLEDQERAMVQQGRILAAALSGRGALDKGDVERLFARLNRRSEARLRVVDAAGNILADTSRATGEAAAAPPAPSGETGPVRRNVLYRLGAFFYDISRRFLPPEPGIEPQGSAVPGRLEGREVRAALSGRYGRATRVSPGQRSVTLSSAIPIESSGRVVGAVVVSQSTYRILQDLYGIRLRISEVCAVSLLLALILSLIVSATIARPIRRLRDEAEAIVDRQGRLRRRFRVLRRRDEIGDLARALETLTRRLEEHVRSLETFASDLAHELKNPLASIRASMEMLSDVGDPEERRRFQRVILEEVARMEHQLSELAEITRIDARLEAEEQVAVPLNGLLQQIAERFRMRENGRIHFLLEMPTEVVTARAAPARLTQVFENVLDNAASFSPDGAAVRVVLSRSADGAAVTISDQGPGIPASHAEKIFDRFFSYRPEGGRSGRRHTGLGLAIVKTIVEGYGGTISAANNPDRGATFSVRLPSSRTGVMPLRSSSGP
jgi:two-component system, OmpR family, sensor histidine kinase ChvG